MASFSVKQRLAVLLLLMFWGLLLMLLQLLSHQIIMPFRQVLRNNIEGENGRHKLELPLKTPFGGTTYLVKGDVKRSAPADRIHFQVV